MMRRTLATGALVTAIGLTLASTVHAQDRTGGWFAVGGGWGSSNISCQECESSEREGSGVGVLRGGWNVNPRTRIGVEYDLWTKTEAVETGVTGTVNLSNVVGTVAYYPSLATPLYVKGGVGLALIDSEFKFENTTVSADMSSCCAIVPEATAIMTLDDRCLNV